VLNGGGPFALIGSHFFNIFEYIFNSHITGLSADAFRQTSIETNRSSSNSNSSSKSQTSLDTETNVSCLFRFRGINTATSMNSNSSNSNNIANLSNVDNINNINSQMDQSINNGPILVTANFDFKSSVREDIVNINGSNGKIQFSLFGNDQPVYIPDAGNTTSFMKEQFGTNEFQKIVISSMRNPNLSRYPIAPAAITTTTTGGQELDLEYLDPYVYMVQGIVDHMNTIRVLVPATSRDADHSSYSNPSVFSVFSTAHNFNRKCNIFAIPVPSMSSNSSDPSQVFYSPSDVATDIVENASKSSQAVDSCLRKYYRNRNDQFWKRPESWHLN
jgi:hypothetical protein